MIILLCNIWSNIISVYFTTENWFYWFSFNSLLKKTYSTDYLQLWLFYKTQWTYKLTLDISPFTEWPSLYGSLIYIYLFNQCLSPMVRCCRNNFVGVSDKQQVDYFLWLFWFTLLIKQTMFSLVILVYFTNKTDHVFSDYFGLLH
jgi:hypothetical protein